MLKEHSIDNKFTTATLHKKASWNLDNVFNSCVFIFRPTFQRSRGNEMQECEQDRHWAMFDPTLDCADRRPRA